MNILEAYDEIWQSLKTLAQKGVKFTISPSRSREIKSTIEKYGQDTNRLPTSLWSHIEFSVTSDTDQLALRVEEARLSALNIAFDTGGGCGIRDWELDWSFFIASDKEIDDMETGREVVKDIIDSMESV